jgi:hypothetical protein
MQKYTVLITGEDRTEFAIEVDAIDVGAAIAEAEEMYPEAYVEDAWLESERREDAYRRAEARYDNPDLDDYDY